MVSRGYNHHMASGFLPVLPLTALWDGAPFSDGPPASQPPASELARPSPMARRPVNHLHLN